MIASAAPLDPRSLDLNNPDTRQSALLARLENGPLVAASLADELDVSLDTIRRDLIALERSGHLRRVRGGAVPVPVAPPMAPFAERVAEPDDALAALAHAAVRLVPERATLLVDGGTTTAAVASRLPEGFAGLVVTPAPAVALAASARGARVHLIGGALCADGAIAVGGATERAIADCAADLAILAPCGLHPAFGLAADDAGEAGVKRAMAAAAERTMVVAGAGKLERRARHRALALDAIDVLVTDAPDDALAPFREAGADVHRA